MRFGGVVRTNPIEVSSWIIKEQVDAGDIDNSLDETGGLSNFPIAFSSLISMILIIISMLYTSVFTWVANSEHLSSTQYAEHGIILNALFLWRIQKAH